MTFTEIDFYAFVAMFGTIAGAGVYLAFVNKRLIRIKKELERELRGQQTKEEPVRAFLSELTKNSNTKTKDELIKIAAKYGVTYSEFILFIRLLALNEIIYRETEPLILAMMLNITQPTSRMGIILSELFDPRDPKIRKSLRLCRLSDSKIGVLTYDGKILAALPMGLDYSYPSARAIALHYTNDRSKSEIIAQYLGELDEKEEAVYTAEIDDRLKVVKIHYRNNYLCTIPLKVERKDKNETPK